MFDIPVTAGDAYGEQVRAVYTEGQVGSHRAQLPRVSRCDAHLSSFRWHCLAAHFPTGPLPPRAAVQAVQPSGPDLMRLLTPAATGGDSAPASGRRGRRGRRAVQASHGDQDPGLDLATLGLLASNSFAGEDPWDSAPRAGMP